MLGVGGFVTIGYDRLPPRTVSVRTLFSRSVGTGVGIICLGHTPASVRTIRGSTSGVRPSVRIVGSTGRGPSVRAVNPAGRSVGAAICIIVRTDTVGGSIRTIDGVSTSRVTIVRWIVVAGAAGQYRGNGAASDESSQISRGVARLDGTFRSRCLSNVGYIVNRRAWRDRVNLFRHRSRRGPWSRRIGRHEPDPLQAKVIDVSYFDYFVRCVSSILEGGPFNRLKLRIPAVGNFRLLCGLRVDYRRSRHLGHQHGVLCLFRARNRYEHPSSRTILRDLGKVWRQLWCRVSPRTAQISCFKPTASGQIVVLLRGSINEEIGIGVGRVRQLRSGNGRVGRLPLEQNDFGRFIRIKYSGRFSLVRG